MVNPPASVQHSGSTARVARLAIGVTLSLVFVFLALRGVSLADLTDALRQANLFWVLVALVCVNLVNFTKTARWQVILRPQAPKVGFARLFAVLMIGQGMNAFAPFRVGDIARAYMVEGVGVGAVLYSVVVEKALDSLMLLGILIGVALVMPLPTWLKQSGIVLSVGLVGVLVVLILAGRGSRLILSLAAWAERTAPALRRLDLTRRAGAAAGLFAGLSQGHVLFPVIIWTLLSWFLGTLANYVTFAAMHVQLDNGPLAATFLILVLYLGAIVPSSPGKVGVFHYLVIISLAVFNVAKGPALAYAVVLHLIVYGPTAILGAYYVWRESMIRGAKQQ